MDKITITNLFNIESESKEISPGVTLVTGVNSSGKSSVASVISALVAYDGNPMHLNAAEKKHYIKDGAANGGATLEYGANVIDWNPMTGFTYPPDVESMSNKHATGAIDFIKGQRGKKERMSMWESMFLPKNVREILSSHWNGDEAQLDAIVTTVERTGWEAALKTFQEKMRESKRRWSDVTGTPFQSAKGSNWRPNHWNADLDLASEDNLYKKLAAARDQLQKLMSVQAVDAELIAQGKRAKEKIFEVDKAIADIREEYKILHVSARESFADEQRVASQIQDLKTHAVEAKKLLNSTAPFECPHCQGGLNFVGGKILAWQEPDVEDIQHAQDVVQDSREKYASLNEEKSALVKHNESARKKLRELQGKISQLEGEKNVLSGTAQYANAELTTVSDEERAKAERTLEEARADLESFKTHIQAQMHFNSFVKLDEVCKLLGPSGARASIMQKNMRQVSAALLKYSGIAGWLPIDINAEYSITSGGRPVRMTAKNEKLKAQWLVQIVCALITKSRYVVLDEADTLRDDSWDGLVKFLNVICAFIPELRVVICATSTESPTEEWDVWQLSATHTS